MTAQLTEAEIQAALSFGTATLYEASGVDCALDPGLRPAWRGAKLAGRAYTVRCHPSDNLPIHHAMARAEAGHVLVVDCGGVLAGYWGEVLAEAALARGLTGLVIDGGVRDVDQMEALGFPVFSRGICVRRTAKHSEGLIDVPLTMAGVAISPGDLIVADVDGIIALSPPQVAATLEASARRMEKEEAIIARLRAGETTMQTFSLPERRGQ